MVRPPGSATGHSPPSAQVRCTAVEVHEPQEVDDDDGGFSLTSHAHPDRVDAGAIVPARPLTDKAMHSTIFSIQLNAVAL